MLGAMLVSQNAIAIVSEILRADDFYRRSHATIYETILQVYAEGGTVDSITLINALQNRGLLDEVGGKAAVHTLASTVPAVANAQRYAEIVRDSSTYRNLIRAGTTIAQLGYERLGEPQELVDQAEQVVFSIADQRITSDFSSIATLLNESFERITQLHEAGREITGVATGFRLGTASPGSAARSACHDAGSVTPGSYASCSSIERVCAVIRSPVCRVVTVSTSTIQHSSAATGWCSTPRGTT